MIVSVEILNELPGIKHAFFTRAGGVSEGIYTGLNCGPGSNDDPTHVARNRSIAMARLGLGGEDLRTNYQVHGVDVITISDALKATQRPHADAMVTAVPGVALGILTADCAPVLLADGEAGVVGAAHAGWRGALDGVTDTVIEAMIDLGAKRSNIRAAVGPCIAQESYEVGPEFLEAFVEEDPTFERFFIPAERDGHHLFDLDEFVHSCIAEAGVYIVQSTSINTYDDEQNFFSYRRATHRGEPDYGRQLSAIALAPRVH